jgi:hypothetical protein
MDDFITWLLKTDFTMKKTGSSPACCGIDDSGYEHLATNCAIRSRPFSIFAREVA